MNYQEFPPVEFFLTVLRHQGDCAYFYLKIWSGHDKNFELMVDKKTVYSTYLVSPTVFKRKLHYLMDEGLLSVTETQYFYEIEFLHDDYEEEEPEPKDKTYEKLTPIS